MSGTSVAKDSSDLSTPEAEVEKTKVEKSSEDEEELNRHAGGFGDYRGIL